MMITNLTVDYIKLNGERSSLRISRSDDKPLRVKLSDTEQSNDIVVKIGNIAVFDRNMLAVDYVTTNEIVHDNRLKLEYFDLPTVGSGAGALHVLIVERKAFLKNFAVLCPYKLKKGTRHKIGETKFYYDSSSEMFFITSHFNSSSKSTASFVLELELSSEPVANFSADGTIDLSKIKDSSDNDLFLDLYREKSQVQKFVKGLLDKTSLSLSLPWGAEVELKKSK